MVGITPETLHQWLSQGRRDVANGSHYTKEARVLIAIQWAESEFQRRQLQTIKRCSEGGVILVPLRNADGSPVLDENGQPRMREVHERAKWEAAAWTLERRFADQYGKRNEINVNHTEGRNNATLSSDQPDQIINLYEQARALLEAARELAKERARCRLEAQDPPALNPPEDEGDDR